MAKRVLSVPRGTKSLARRLYIGKSPIPTGKTVTGQYVQSTCRGLGSNPVWIAYCVQLCSAPAPWGWLSKDCKRIIGFSPMNKHEPQAEKRRCVQRNQTAYESSQPGALSLDDFQTGFAGQNTLGFFFCGWKEMDPWSFLLQLESGRRRMGTTGMESDAGPRWPLRPGKVDSLMGVLGLFSCKTQQRLLETQNYEGTRR